MKFKSFLLPSVFAVTLLFNFNVCAAEKLLFAVDIIRHGDRTPCHGVPTATYQWKEGFGQLTTIGIKQEYELGAKLRRQYVDHYHLLPAAYQPGTLYVRSTDYDRTLMSADSLLLGLYPTNAAPQITAHLAYQPIPIHTVDFASDHLLIFEDNNNKRHEIFKKYVYNTPEWIEMNNKYQSLYAKWSKDSGLNLTNLADLPSVGDYLFVAKVHGVPYPSSIDAKEASKIIEAGKWAFAHLFQSQQACSVFSHELITSINDYLQNANKKAPLKFVLFSAHDDTIMGLLGALHVPVKIPPHYASHVSFQLFEDQGQQYVKVFYNDEPQNIPACGGARCSLIQLNNLTQQVEKMGKM